jgi:DNA invertase Pin-like site-specific DNA recombinase
LVTTVAFLSETQGSATIEDQKTCLAPDDYVLVAGERGFNQLGELLARHGLRLKAGDHVKVYDLPCLGISTATLIRELSKLLREGISVEIAARGIIIKPNTDDRMAALLDALDSHRRHLHGIKTHPTDTAPQGRKRLLDPGQLSEIRDMLEKPGATATKVAKKLGVARSTLFNYLERFDGNRNGTRGKKAIKRGIQDTGDDAHISE